MNRDLARAERAQAHQFAHRAQERHVYRVGVLERDELDQALARFESIADGALDVMVVARRVPARDQGMRLEGVVEREDRGCRAAGGDPRPFGWQRPNRGETDLIGSATPGACRKELVEPVQMLVIRRADVNVRAPGVELSC